MITEEMIRTILLVLILGVPILIAAVRYVTLRDAYGGGPEPVLRADGRELISPLYNVVGFLVFGALVSLLFWVFGIL